MPFDHQSPAFDVPARSQPHNPDGSVQDVPFDFEGSSAGLGSLAPEGLPDHVQKARAAASKELANMFQVSESYGGAGKRLPNQITPEQFEEVCAIYGDISTGNGSISLEYGEMGAEQGTKFRADMMREIATMLQTDAGRVLLKSLNSGRHDVRLRAHHTDTDGDGNHMNDGNSALDNSQAEASAEYPNRGYVGGQGSEVDVLFNPGKDIVTAIRESGNESLRSDTVLFHELVHAYHQVNATTVGGCATLVPEDAGDNELEHQAMGVGKWARSFFHGREDDLDWKLTENNYRAERAKLGGTAAARKGDVGMQQRKAHNHGGPISRADFCGGPDAYDKYHANDHN